VKEGDFKDRRILAANPNSTENKRAFVSVYCKTTFLESFSSTSTKAAKDKI